MQKRDIYLSVNNNVSSPPMTLLVWLKSIHLSHHEKMVAPLYSFSSPTVIPAYTHVATEGLVHTATSMPLLICLNYILYIHSLYMYVCTYNINVANDVNNQQNTTLATCICM